MKEDDNHRVAVFNVQLPRLSDVKRLLKGDFQKLRWERDKKKMADLETKSHGFKTTMGKSFTKRGVKGLTLKSRSWWI